VKSILAGIAVFVVAATVLFAGTLTGWSFRRPSSMFLGVHYILAVLTISALAGIIVSLIVYRFA
jgi:hypothetical protein